MGQCSRHIYLIDISRNWTVAIHVVLGPVARKTAKNAGKKVPYNFLHRLLWWPGLMPMCYFKSNKRIVHTFCSIGISERYKKLGRTTSMKAYAVPGCRRILGDEVGNPSPWKTFVVSCMWVPLHSRLSTSIRPFLIKISTQPISDEMGCGEILIKNGRIDFRSILRFSLPIFLHYLFSREISESATKQLQQTWIRFFVKDV